MSVLYWLKIYASQVQIAKPMSGSHVDDPNLEYITPAAMAYRLCLSIHH